MVSCPVIALQPKHASLWVVWVSSAALGKLGVAPNCRHVRAARNACGEQCPVIALQPKDASLWVVWVSPAALGKLGRS